VPNTTTVIVGAGHCGLAMSHCLAARSVEHVVLERGQVANAWRTQRWDSLRLLTPNWMTRLPDLVRAADHGGALSEQEMLSTIFQLVVAGHDTTTSLIGNGTVALLLHPQQRDRLLADPALMPHAIEEILRWDAPVPHSTFRYATQDVAFGGTVIPAFAQVIISLAAANRDPARYDRPETLDITRADTSHLAFGHGIHHCLGARLARLEGAIALTTLHGRFPAMRLAVPRSALRWGHGDGLVLRGLSELPVILGP